MRGIDLQFTEEVMNSFPNPSDYLAEIASVFVTNVKSRAQQTLHTSRQDYINAVTQHPFQVDGDRLSVIIELVGAFPNMLEQGQVPYNMRPGLIKDGDSQIIFMRKGTPQSVRFQRMSTEQHQIMKNLRTSSDRQTFPAFLTKGKSNVTAYGVSRTKSSARQRNLAGQRHRDHINQRMQKIVRKGGPTYGTFRTISNVTNTNSWFHPGFEGLDLFDLVLRDMGLEE